MAKPTRLEEIWASTGAIVDPGQTKVELGWEAEIPPYQHFNYIMNKTSEMLDHINTNGIPEWDAATTYAVGSRTLYNGNVYKQVNTLSDTGTTPGTDASVWYLVPVIIEAFDYVVDSDAKLQALCAGTISGATRVLVKSGTWTANTGSSWSLTQTDTEYVYGEYGNNLVGNTDDSFIYGNSDSRLVNVNASQNGSHIYSEVFANIHYMIGCTAESTVSSSNSFCFRNCSNLINCKGIRSSQGYTFSECSNLTNCQSLISNVGAGFIGCTNLSSCSVTFLGTVGTDSISGFTNCNSLSACSCEMTSSANFNLIGFNGCRRMSTCSVDITGTGIPAYGFYNCEYLIVCYAEVVGSILAAFRNCEYVYICDGVATTIYDNCNGLNTNTAL